MKTNNNLRINIKVSAKKANRNEFLFELVVESLINKPISLKIPLWRPGRYEAADYAKYYNNWQILDVDYKPLEYSFDSPHSILIPTPTNTIHISYTFSARQYDAGGSYCDPNIYYFNPINCVPTFQTDGVYATHIDRVSVVCPTTFDYAGALKAQKTKLGFRFFNVSFEKLYDSPMFFSEAKNLQHFTLAIDQHTIHYWVHGAYTFDIHTFFNKMEICIKHQLKVMQSYPFTDYHFLFLFKKEQAYHGVEHADSTVITLGPTVEEKNDWFMENLLAISSHEFFHLWNVCRLKPPSLFNNQYPTSLFLAPIQIKEGYLIEGLTTLMGDYLLYSSGAVSKGQFAKEISTFLKRHEHNWGRFEVTLEQSSILLWLHGYQSPLLYKKVSIYNEGALFWLLIDLLLREKSENKSSILDFLKKYSSFFNKERKAIYGEDETLINQKPLEKILISTKEIIQLLTEIQPKIDWTHYFDTFLKTANDYIPLIKAKIKWLSLKVEQIPFTTPAGYLGYQCNSDGVIIDIWPDSPADQVLCYGDIIIEIEDSEKENHLLLTIIPKGTAFLDQEDLKQQEESKKIELPYNLSKTYYDTFEVIDIN